LAIGYSGGNPWFARHAPGEGVARAAHQNRLSFVREMRALLNRNMVIGRLAEIRPRRLAFINFVIGRNLRLSVHAALHRLRDRPMRGAALALIEGRGVRTIT